jgi:hypothetical protein
MTSKEALDKICKVKIYQKEASAYDYLGKEIYKEEIEIIKQDLERLEVLEQENQEYFEIICKQAYLLNNKHIDKPIIEKLIQENEKLKKALELACERLSWDCPVAQDLIDDLDCEKTCGDCNMKECWVKYFMKKVLENDIDK